SERHDESNKEAMRRIFMDVPVIYGFSSMAPLGPTAAALLSRYFQSAPDDEFGSGRPSGKLLASFAANSMTVTGGLTASDPRAGLMDVARTVGWLSIAEQRAELIRMIGDQLAGNTMSSAEVNWICSLNKRHQLDQELHRLTLSPKQANTVTSSAALACLGNRE